MAEMQTFLALLEGDELSVKDEALQQRVHKIRATLGSGVIDVVNDKYVLGDASHVSVDLHRGIVRKA